ncbi:MAG: fasciclin domain-containing protein [Planctomycetota bacterium]
MRTVSRTATTLIASGTLLCGLAAIAPDASAHNHGHKHAHNHGHSGKMSDKPSIAQLAATAGSFETLVAAVDAAGLLDTLASKGPFTVFAPTDDAFGKLGSDTISQLLKPEARDTLTGVLTYHVVPGTLTASDLIGRSSVTTVNGQRLSVSFTDGTLAIDGVPVAASDLEASNGVVHVVGTVLMPATDNIVETAQNAGTFNTLIAAAKAAGLAGALTSDGPLTVFAPTDDAFAKLPAGTVESLLKPENRDQLAAILKYHVVSGRVYADQAVTASSADTLQGDSVNISVAEGGVKINDARVVAADIDASNGVIHVIDSVLLPGQAGAMNTGDANAAEVIRLAIQRGAPMYNHGQREACVAIYEVAVMSLVERPDISADARESLARALHQARNQHRASDRAWSLRRGMDAAFAELSGGQKMAMNLRPQG